MSDNATEDSLATTVILGGKIFTGMQQGEGFSTSYDNDHFEKVVGVRGLGAWQKKFDLSATMTLSLLATSDDNDIMSVFADADFFTTGGFMFPGALIQSNGRLRVAWAAGRIMKKPDISLSDGVDVRVWVMGTTKLISFIGGQTSTPVGTFEEASALANALPSLRPAV